MPVHEAYNFMKKETPAQVCSYEVCKIFKNIFFCKMKAKADDFFQCV